MPTVHLRRFDPSYDTGIELIASGKQLTNLYVSGLTFLLESRFFSNFVISNDEFLKEGCKIEKKENIFSFRHQRPWGRCSW